MIGSVNPVVDDKPGGVWVVNGPSSAGKSSLVEELRLRLRQVTLGFALDDFFRMAHWQVHNQPGGFNYERGPEGVRIGVGALGADLLASWRRACATLWAPGVYVLVDDVKLEHDWQDRWESCLNGIPHKFIGVTCDLGVLELREVERGDREVGLARGHFADVHRDVKYDTQVDTSTLSVERAADAVARALEVQLHRLPAAPEA